MASEEMLFENADDGQTTDACLYYKLTFSLQLRWAKKESYLNYVDFCVFVIWPHLLINQDFVVIEAELN